MRTYVHSQPDALAEGAPLTDTLRLFEKVAGENAVLCTHGDVVGNLIEHLTHAGVPVDDDRLEKGSIWELEMREGKATADAASKTDVSWGHQIRSYVLQPYQMVKDLRTGVSTSSTGAVLDGDLDQFMEAALAQKAFGEEPKEVEDPPPPP